MDTTTVTNTSHSKKPFKKHRKFQNNDASAIVAKNDTTTTTTLKSTTKTTTTSAAAVVVNREQSKNKKKKDKKQKNQNENVVEEEEEKRKRAAATSKFVNRQRTLILAKSGVSAHHRHLMADLLLLLPHGKKEAKYGTRSSRDYTQINDLCEMRKCPNTLFFESYSGGKELYMYAARSPQGPTIKFKVSNISTMAELKMTGNSLKGSRPVMHFDAAFDGNPLLRLMKEMFTQVFATPQGHPKSKPFVDHVFGFFVLDGKIWFRNYQIVDRTPAGEKMNLVEIGPRFVLDPVRVLEGCFEGDVLYNNDQFVSLRDKVRERAQNHKELSLESRRRKREYVEQINDTKRDPVKMVWHEKLEMQENNNNEDDDDDEDDDDYDAADGSDSESDMQMEDIDESQSDDE